MGLPVYKGKFGEAEAERLLWRAGFGPAPGQARKLAKKGLRGAVHSLTRPPKRARLRGPAPVDEDGVPLAPRDAYGHDHLWWLDRMVRTNQPLVERMTLAWHDWFATGDVGDQRWSLKQNQTMRKHALGSFRELLLAVTKDPAMLLWLSGVDNTKYEPNENYGRELMELFTLGEGRGYTETDVREQARALTGFTNDYDEGVGAHNFHFDPSLHDKGRKRILGHSGRYDWRDSCLLCLRDKNHPSFLVNKLWSYFVPVPPPRGMAHALARLYTRNGYRVRPLVQAILLHPLLYKGPRLVKPPVVLVAGLLRARGRGIATEDWTWISNLAGQRLFDPPNVAGWDEDRWLDTATLRGRWIAAARVLDDEQLDPDEPYDTTEGAAAAVDAALGYWGDPKISATTRHHLESFAQRSQDAANEPWQQSTYRVLRQNALRLLIAASPDLQAA